MPFRANPFQLGPAPPVLASTINRNRRISIDSPAHLFRPDDQPEDPPTN